LAESEATQLEEEEQERDLCLVKGIEEVLEEVDEGYLLIIRRMLSGLKGSQD